VGCLYCGKEIGPIRAVHDKEFCSSVHRKSYSARLSKVIANIATPEPPPAGIAPFLSPLRADPGSNLDTHTTPWTFDRIAHPMEIRRPRPIGIRSVLGASFRQPGWRDCAPASAEVCQRSLADASPFRPLRLPGLMLEPVSPTPAANDTEPDTPRPAPAVGFQIPPADLMVPLPRPAAAFWQARQLWTPVDIASPKPPTPDLAGTAAAPGAEPVETILPALPVPSAIEFASGTAALPALALDVARLTGQTDTLEPRGPVAAPAAQAAETLLPASPEAVAVPFADNALLVPKLAYSRPAFTLEQTGFTAAPRPEPVESLLPTVAHPVAVPFVPRLLAVPALALHVETEIPRQQTDTPPAPMASVAFADLLRPPAPPLLPVAALHTLAPPIALFPPKSIESHPAARIAPAAWAPTAKAELVEALLPPLPQPVAAPFELPTPALPTLTLTAGDPQILEPTPEVIEICPASEVFLRSLPACEAEREVQPLIGASRLSAIALQVPSIVSLGLIETTVRQEAGLLQAPSPEPVVAYVAPRLANATPRVSAPQAALSIPDFTSLGKPELKEKTQGPLAAPVDGPAPSPVESEVLPAYRKSALTTTRPIEIPALPVSHITGNSAGDFQNSVPLVVAPPSAAPNPQPERLRADRGPSLPGQPKTIGLSTAAMPRPGLLPMEFFSQQASMAPARRLNLLSPPIAPALPKFNIRPILDNLEEADLSHKPRNAAGLAEILKLPGARNQRPRRSNSLLAIKLLAASLLIGVAIWYGAGATKIGHQMLAVNTDSQSYPATGGTGTTTYSAQGAAPSSPASTAPAHSGPMAKVRRAIQERAAVELTDSFKGMEAWGATAKALPAGWSRHPDGYVKTGQLALYGPSLSFTDYHLEFLGEIENKAMSWAVRAHDANNYYAMKFRVIEPGLRPVIAVVHYPVVSGKRGQSIETPLNVMVHNLTSYHISVDIKGDHIVTSIDGQEVDSFTDDTLKVGGVGFFADAGESARLYWMKVTKNQDWMGRVCAYFAGGSDNATTGELWQQDYAVPDSGVPSWPAPGGGPSGHGTPPKDSLLAVNEAGETSFTGPQRVRITRNGRTESCS
jgi:hypothetical protein